MIADTSAADAEIRRLLLEAGRLAEQSGMPPEQFVAEFMAVLQALMVEQAERDGRAR